MESTGGNSIKIKGVPRVSLLAAVELLCEATVTQKHPEEVPRRYKVGRHRIVHILNQGGNFGYAYSSSHSRFIFTTPHDHLEFEHIITCMARNSATGTTLGGDRRCLLRGTELFRPAVLAPRLSPSSSLSLAWPAVLLEHHSLHSRDRRFFMNGRRIRRPTVRLCKAFCSNVGQDRSCGSNVYSPAPLTLRL